MPSIAGLPEIFLSASVPRLVPGRDPKYVENVPPDVAFEINEAITALTAATLALGARLVFGGHPSITPLVAQTVLDYVNLGLEAVWDQTSELQSQPLMQTLMERASVAPTGERSLAESMTELPENERPIVVYQSRLYETEFVDEVSVLRDSGVAHVYITEAIDSGRPLSNASPDQLAEVRKIKQIRDESLVEMRTRMLTRTNLVAMAAIGGLEGVEDEAKLFAKAHPGKPIFAFVGTGGATRYLAGIPELRNVVQVDSAYLRDLFQGIDVEIPPADLKAAPDGSSPLPMTPYALIMTRLLERLLPGSWQGER